MNFQRMFKISGNTDGIIKIGLSVGLSLVLILFSGLVIFDTLRSFSEAHSKAQIVKREAEKVARLRLENLEKNQDFEYVVSDEYVEREARSKFNYMKNGEVVFILPETDIVKNESFGSLDHLSSKSPVQEWIEVLLN